MERGKEWGRGQGVLLSQKSRPLPYPLTPRAETGELSKVTSFKSGIDQEKNLVLHVWHTSRTVISAFPVHLTVSLYQPPHRWS